MEGRDQDFDTEADARTQALSMSGIVLVDENPAGSVITLGDGRELEDEEATKATMDQLCLQWKAPSEPGDVPPQAGKQVVSL